MPSVLHVTHFDPPLHGEAMMAKLLQDAGKSWKQDVIYHSINAAFATRRDQLGAFNPRKVVLLARFLAATILARFRHRSDILLVHPCFHRGSFLKDSLFIWLGRLLGMKVIAWVHMDPDRIGFEQCPRWFRKWLLATLDRVDHFVACAPSLPERWPQWLKDRPYVCIANAIPDPLGGESPVEGGRSTESLRVIYLSAMHQEKGWQDLFEAACQICDRLPEVEFHFHGDVAAKDEEILQKTLASSNHPDRIRWLGPAYGPEKAAAFLRSDIFVFPSHTEQFPLAVLEAMAYGLPVIATRVGAISDALVEPDGGRLIPSRSSESLRQRLEELLTKPKALKQMGEFNRTRYIREFTPETFERRWHDFLQSK